MPNRKKSNEAVVVAKFPEPKGKPSGRSSPPGQGKSKAARKRRNKKAKVAAVENEIATAQEAETRSTRSADRRWGFGVKDLHFSSRSATRSAPRADLVANSQMVGLGERTRPIVRVMPHMEQGRTRKGVMTDELVGHDILCSVTVPAAGAVPGDVLCRIKLNPKELTGTRVSQYAPLYNQFEFLQLMFEYEPVASAVTSGQVIGFHDPDPENEYVNETGNLQRAAAFAGSCPVQIWDRACFNGNKTDDYTDLFIKDNGIDERLTYQGQFVLIANSTLTAGDALGLIYLHYRCAYFVPQLSQDSQTLYAAFSDTGAGVDAGTPFGTGALPRWWDSAGIGYLTGFPMDKAWLTYDGQAASGASQIAFKNPDQCALIVCCTLTGTGITVWTGGPLTIAGAGSPFGTGCINAAGTSLTNIIVYNDVPEDSIATIPAVTATTITGATMLLLRLSPLVVQTASFRRRMARIVSMCKDRSERESEDQINDLRRRLDELAKLYGGVTGSMAVTPIAKWDAALEPSSEESEQSDPAHTVVLAPPTECQKCGQFSFNPRDCPGCRKILAYKLTQK